MAEVSVCMNFVILQKLACFSHAPFAGGGSLKSLDSSCVMTHSGDRTKRDACTATIRNELVGKLTDRGAVEFFRQGAPVYGILPVSGVGPLVDNEISIRPEQLWNNRQQSNARLLQRLSEDDHAQELHRLTQEDAKLARMS